MKFCIQSEDFARESQFVKTAVKGKTTIPILANFAIIPTDPGAVQLIGTDLSRTLLTEVAASVSSASGGGICVSGAKLTEILGVLPDAPVFAETAANGWLNLKCGKSSYKLKTTTIESFPETPRVPKLDHRIKAETLDNFITFCQSAISHEHTRFTLAGALLEINGRESAGKIRMVTTDGHRLSLIETDYKGNAEEFVEVIPAAAVGDIKKMCDRNTKEILFGSDADHLYFKTGARTIITRKISGKFPDYQKVIPTGNDLIIEADTRIFARAVARVRQMCHPRHDGIFLTAAGGKLKIFADDGEGGTGEDTISLPNSPAEEITLKYQSKYLHEFTTSAIAAGSGTIRICVRDRHTQSLFQPEKNGKITKFTIIMPLSF